MEEKLQLDIGTQVLPLVGSHKHYFSPNLQQAELHGKAYKIHKGFEIDSQSCQCCNSHLIQDYFNLFCNIKEFKYNRAAYLYFLQLQQFIVLFCIPCVVFLPYALYFNSQGDQCEKMKNCIPSYYNKFSIWNHTQDYFWLENFYLQFLYLLTVFLSSIGVYLMIFGNKYKTFLSNQYSRAILLQSVMITQDQEEIKFIQESEVLKNYINLKVHSLDKFQESIKNSTESYYIQAHLDNQKYILDKAIFQERVNPHLIQQGTIIIFSSESEKFEFSIQNKDIIKEDGVQRYVTQNHTKMNCKIIFKILAIIIVALLTILSLALNLYIQAKYLKTKSNLGERQVNFFKILLYILFFFQIYFSNIFAKMLLHHNNYQQIYFTCLVIGFKNINRIFQAISNQEAYLQENGIVDNLIILCYLNIILPNLITIFELKYLINQFKKIQMRIYKKTNLTQIEINKYFEARQLSFEQKQYNVFQICLIGQIFIIDFPLIAPFTIIALCSIYWIDKCIFVKNCIPFQNQWGEDNTLEIQKQQFLLFYMMYCIQNFFFFKNPILIFGMLGYIILFKIFMARKLDTKIFQNKKTIKPEKLKEYAQQYDLVHVQGEMQHIKHQHLYQTFKTLMKYLSTKLQTTRTQLEDSSI